MRGVGAPRRRFTRFPREVKLTLLANSADRKERIQMRCHLGTSENGRCRHSLRATPISAKAAKTAPA